MKASAAAIALLFGVGLGAAAHRPIRKLHRWTVSNLYADEDGGRGMWTVIAHVTTALGRRFDAPFVDGRDVN